jgi:hypothetical protein
MQILRDKASRKRCFAQRKMSANKPKSPLIRYCIFCWPYPNKFFYLFSKSRWRYWLRLNKGSKLETIKYVMKGKL